MVKYMKKKNFYYYYIYYISNSFLWKYDIEAFTIINVLIA